MPSSNPSDATVALTATGVHDPGDYASGPASGAGVLTPIVHTFDALRNDELLCLPERLAAGGRAAGRTPRAEVVRTDPSM